MSWPILDTSCLAPADVRMEGKLEKKRATFGSWATRYYYLCVVDGSARLSYKMTKDDNAQRGEMMLPRFAVSVSDSEDRVFIVETKEKFVVFRAPTALLRAQWVAALNTLRKTIHANKPGTDETDEHAVKCSNCSTAITTTSHPVQCEVCERLLCGAASCIKTDSHGRILCQTCYSRKLFASDALLLTVVQADGLAAFDSGGTSDPYCVVKFSNTEYTTPVRHARTTKIIGMIAI